MTSAMIRLAKIGADVCAERVPGFWVRVAEYEEFSSCQSEVKIFLVQHALTHNPDFEWEIRLDDLL